MSTYYRTLLGIPAAIALCCLFAPGVCWAYPQSGDYVAVEGQSYSFGVFNIAAELIVDEGDGSATFEFWGTTYSGSFTDASTLEISGCYGSPANPTGGESILAQWTLSFPTEDTLVWSGLAHFYDAAACTGTHLALADYDDLNMILESSIPDDPEPVSYESAPGSSTSQGNFNETAVLTLDSVNSTATFEFDGSSFSGTLVSETRVEFDGCMSINPVAPLFALGAAISWAFDFDLDGSFVWTGTSSYYAAPSCAGGVMHSVEYTDVRMVSSPTVSVERTSWSALKSKYR